VATAMYDKIKLSKREIHAGQNFEITSKVSSKQEGICFATLYIDDEPFVTKYLWLNKNQTKNIAFSDLKIEAIGEHKIRLGDSLKSVSLKVTK
jgi:hypothetical protein